MNVPHHRQQRTRSPRQLRRCPSRQPRFEALEGRRLLAADASIALPADSVDTVEVAPAVALGEARAADAADTNELASCNEQIDAIFTRLGTNPFDEALPHVDAMVAGTRQPVGENPPANDPEDGDEAPNDDGPLAKDDDAADSRPEGQVVQVFVEGLFVGGKQPPASTFGHEGGQWVAVTQPNGDRGWRLLVPKVVATPSDDAAPENDSRAPAEPQGTKTEGTGGAPGGTSTGGTAPGGRGADGQGETEPGEEEPGDGPVDEADSIGEKAKQVYVRLNKIDPNIATALPNKGDVLTGLLTDAATPNPGGGTALTVTQIAVDGVTFAYRELIPSNQQVYQDTGGKALESFLLKTGIATDQAEASAVRGKMEEMAGVSIVEEAGNTGRQGVNGFRDNTRRTVDDLKKIGTTVASGIFDDTKKFFGRLLPARRR